LDHADFSRLKEDHAHFCLDIQVSELSTDEEVTVCVTEGSAVHARVEHVHIKSKTFPNIGITASSQRVEAIGEINPFVVFWEREWVPFSLLWQSLNLWIYRQKTVLNV
jgi:hypothetical protein